MTGRGPRAPGWAGQGWRLPGRHLPAGVWTVLGLQLLALILLPAAAPGWAAPSVLVVGLVLVVRVARRTSRRYARLRSSVPRAGDGSAVSCATAVGGPCDGLKWEFVPGRRPERMLWLETTAGGRFRYRLAEANTVVRSFCGAGQAQVCQVYVFISPDADH